MDTSRVLSPVSLHDALPAQRIIWASAAILAIGLLQSVYWQSADWGPGAVLIALGILAATRPSDGLLVTAAMVPLATILLLAVAARPGGVRYHEALALAFIGGWAAQRAVRPRPPVVSPTLLACIVVLLAVVMASAVASETVGATESAALSRVEHFRVLLVREYLVRTGPLNAALLLAEGLVLMVIAAETCAAEGDRRDAALRMIVIGAAGAALMNVLRLVEVALRHEHPVPAFISDFSTLRVNVHYPDLNAAGSYFALALLASAGLRARALAVVAAVLTAAALWLTGSRTAMAAVFLTAVAGGMLALRVRSIAPRLLAAAIIAGLVIGAALMWRAYPTGRNPAAGWSLSTRVEFASAALRMAAEEPVFGVGIGRFYVLSEEYLGRVLASYGQRRENAHNYFLQLLAELGIPGLLLFLVVLGLALRAAWRAAGQRWQSRALFGGLIAFLLTCFGGHPLLVGGAAIPFWIALGVAAAPPAMTPPRKGDRYVRAAAIALVATIVGTLPLRTARAAGHANLEHVGAGFSRWQQAPDGVRYRWAGGRSFFYVSSSAVSVRIPLRHGGTTNEPVEVVMFLEGREVNRVLLPPDAQWRSVRIMPRREDAPPFSRIDLEARRPGDSFPLPIEPTDTSGAMLVGRPVIDF